MQKPDLVNRLKHDAVKPPSNPVAPVKKPDAKTKNFTMNKAYPVQAGNVNALKKPETANNMNPIPAQNPKIEDKKIDEGKPIEPVQKKSSTLNTSEAKPKQEALPSQLWCFLENVPVILVVDL